MREGYSARYSVRYSVRSNEGKAESLLCRLLDEQNDALRDMTPYCNSPCCSKDERRNTMEEERQGTPATRNPRRQLEFLAAHMPPRDLDVLSDIGIRRYMTSGQICRLRFGTAGTPGSAQRIANRVINRLKGHGLVISLNRRIGGKRGGSGDNIWALTPAGFRLLHLDEENQPRKRNFEPSQRLMEHTLAIVELDIQLRSMEGVAITEAQFEPACWRKYDERRLKPDYYAATAVGRFEDHWFFEIDLATETPYKVVDKCKQYQDYYYSNEELRRIGIFPRVVWVTPDEKRRETIRRHIREDRALTAKKLFFVIVPGELEHMVRTGEMPL